MPVHTNLRRNAAAVCANLEWAADPKYHREVQRQRCRSLVTRKSKKQKKLGSKI